MRAQRRRLAYIGVSALVAAVGAAAFLLRAPDPSPEQPQPSLMDRALARVDASSDAFAPPSGPWTLTLPDDHGAHADMRTESWSLVANLSDEAGAPLSLEFTLLRLSLAPPTEDESDTPWTLRTLYRAHIAGTGSAFGGSAAEERFSRGAFGVAGHDPETGIIRLDDWTLAIEGARLVLDATLGARSLSLAVSPAKPPTETGAGGESGPVRGYALTRMDAEGRLRGSAGETRLSGSAWLDHLWGELPLPGGPIAWDRLQLHFEDGVDLSVVRSRRRRSGDAVSAQGFLVRADGAVDPLSPETLRMEPVRSWRAPDGAAYPVAWRLSADETDLTIEAVSDDQLRAFAQPIWTGAVTAEGVLEGRRVEGVGALNLTGYGNP